MKYIPCTLEQEKEILKSLGVKSFSDLISIIPENLRFKGSYNLSDPYSELELISHIENLSNNNILGTSFLGTGAYDRYVPSIVDFLASRSEFYTAYTPYQPEVSQGTLQYIYEYQSMICELSGMDYSNASLYDGASALAEACILSSGYNGKNQILISPYLYPSYKEVLKTYLSGLDIKMVQMEFNESGKIDINNTLDLINDNVSCIVVQSPNYLGQLEDLSLIKSKIHKDMLLISVGDPVSLGALKSPGDCGADIYVGEGQALGNYLSYGGPYLGILALKETYLRRMPGRIVGKTIDIDGRDGYVLTLQTREQHIRRERATSNICTNQGLIALRSTIYMSIMGKIGIKEVNQLSLNKAYYLASEIDKISGFNVVHKNNFINEFIVDSKYNIQDILKECSSAGYYLNSIDNKYLLIAVTEKRTKSDLDGLLDTLKAFC